jgi:hypothetical protein
MSDLSDAVDALAEPIEEHIAQIGDDGRWLRAHTVNLPPLLQQLRDRINPTGGNDGASKVALPAERSPADLNVLLQYAKISSAIRSWCHIRKVPVTRPPKVDVSVDLKAWGAHADADGTLEGTWYVRELTKWAHLIETLLRPGESFEADYPCPICKATGWGNAIDGGSSRAILVTYQKDDDGRVFDERAVCRGRDCNTVWVGHDSLMELAAEQHEITRL